MLIVPVGTCATLVNPADTTITLVRSAAHERPTGRRPVGPTAMVLRTRVTLSVFDCVRVVDTPLPPLPIGFARSTWSD